MQFHEFGDRANPHVMLIHGGGNAWWNFLRQARALSDRYHVILPTLDGHGEEYATDYVSTEDSADKLLAYIDSHCQGRLFALAGVSLGGQIVIELLARRPDLTQKAIVDGSICYPTPWLARFSIATVTVAGPLLFSRRACRFQLALMHRTLPAKMRFPQEIEEHYLRDMPRLRMKTLRTIYRTYMNYDLKDAVGATTAQVMYWYGEKEPKSVKRSARLFRTRVPSCELYEAKRYNHGYLAVYLPDEWLAIAVPFFER